MKKISIIKYLLMIVFIMFFININVKASERPDNISVEQVANYEFWTGRTTEGDKDCQLNSLCPHPMSAQVENTRAYVYSLQQQKGSSIGSTMTNATEIMSVLNSNVPDYGLIYLMNQTSYASDNTNKDGYKKVQAAIWLYMYYHRGEVVNDPTITGTGTNVGYVFGTTSSPNIDRVYLNPSNALIAIDLYNRAVAEDEAHKNDAGDGFTLSQPASDVFDVTGDTLTSREVTVNITGSNSCGISVTNVRVVNNNNQVLNETVNAYTIDANNNRINTAGNGTKVRVRIEGFNEGSEVKTIYATLKVSCDSSINHVYKYKCRQKVKLQ